MPAAVNADDATKPLDNDLVNYPASMGAAEFRALKAKVNAVFLATGINKPGQEYLVELNGTGLYSKYSVNPALTTTILYGFASDVTRTGKDQHTVGGQFSAYLGPGLNLAAGEVFGVVSQAISNSTSVATLVAAEFAVGNFYPNITTQGLIGVDIVFKDRMDVETTPAAGLGANRYNVNAVAIQVSAQARGTAGEYCGWNTAMKFTEFSMDLAAGVRGYGIDFKALHYDGGGDPGTAYRVDAVIRMRALQSIILDDSGTDKLRFYFDPFSGRIVFTTGGAERWGLDVATGQVYKNGLLQY